MRLRQEVQALPRAVRLNERRLPIFKGMHLEWKEARYLEDDRLAVFKRSGISVPVFDMGNTSSGR